MTTGTLAVDEAAVSATEVARTLNLPGNAGAL